MSKIGKSYKGDIKMTWADLGKEILAISPYALLTFLAFVGVYFIFKVSVNAVQKQSESAIKEMRKAYDDALKRINEAYNKKR